MKYSCVWIVLLCALAAVGETSAAVAELRLKLTSDTLTAGTAEERNSFPLSAVNDHDTLRVWNVESFTFYAGGDSLVVRKTATFVPIVIEGLTRTLNLTIWFCSAADQLAKELQVLRQFPTFGGTPVPRTMAFGYATPDDSNLVMLRGKYHLDSVAGNGSDISRMINLMRWVHKAAPHDGSSTNPSPRNALHLLSVCADSGRGVNCRMIATILNEVCLSVGFKSRHLTCMPEDKNDPDCHVVNMIWSDSLRKWVYIDPTFQAYFTDQSGVMLSPREIRDAFVKGDSLILSDDLDYQGSPHDPAQYKTYMAKNLFRFLAPLKSDFGYESNDGDVLWVYLHPVGYQLALVGTADTTSSTHGRHIDYYTDNAAWFWGE